jgi:hypothetical protein
MTVRGQNGDLIPIDLWKTDRYATMLELQFLTALRVS